MEELEALKRLPETNEVAIRANRKAVELERCESSLLDLHDLADALGSGAKQRKDGVPVIPETFEQLVDLLADDSFRETEGRELALMQRATEQVADNWAGYTELLDATVDRVLLTHETVELGDDTD